ncbi:TadE/TadG family type IV pilus assembly protein [Candidatus Nitronereus thalassa]|uniref:Pilus assembly protein n=1 Tax=Candidatus Nitronereus thalassa TaxID=3020898 RepID=A0ABU3K3M8_9BACT|nr:TadE/TadG family type IV pilus assembly protein [Candidatus Nitronereus thalassa]MDT7040997.1 pilus assembly protein [Candidatus Nitronereus thalassa]
MANHIVRNQKGMAAVEFSVLVSIALLIIFVIVDFGTLIQAQAVVTNITREGGSLASRDLKNGSDLLDLMAESSAPLNFTQNPELYKIYLAKADAGENASNPDPTCTVQELGSLDAIAGNGVDSPANSPTCDLPQNLYDLLKYDDSVEVQAAPISQFTIVKVYYVHQPVTPLEEFFNASGHTVNNYDLYDELGQYGQDGESDGILITSKAVF